MQWHSPHKAPAPDKQRTCWVCAPPALLAPAQHPCIPGAALAEGTLWGCAAVLGALSSSLAWAAQLSFSEASGSQPHRTPAPTSLPLKIAFTSSHSSGELSSARTLETTRDCCCGPEGTDLDAQDQVGTPVTGIFVYLNCIMIIQGCC